MLTDFTKYPPKPENILQILHIAQDANPWQYLSEDDLIEVANYLKMPYNQVYSVASFYSMFALQPRGKFVIKVCLSPHCVVQGSDNLFDYLKKETKSLEDVSLEACQCLGVCGNAPVVLVNDKIYGNMNQEKLEGLLQNLKGGENVL